MIADELARALRRTIPADLAGADPQWLADITSDLSAASIMIAETMARVDLARP